jgi:hypothetical protein
MADIVYRGLRIAPDGLANMINGVSTTMSFAGNAIRPAAAVNGGVRADRKFSIATQMNPGEAQVDGGTEQSAALRDDNLARCRTLPLHFCALGAC